MSSADPADPAPTGNRGVESPEEPRLEGVHLDADMSDATDDDADLPTPLLQTQDVKEEPRIEWVGDVDGLIQREADGDVKALVQDAAALRRVMGPATDALADDSATLNGASANADAAGERSAAGRAALQEAQRERIPSAAAETTAVRVAHVAEAGDPAVGAEACSGTGTSGSGGGGDFVVKHPRQSKKGEPVEECVAQDAVRTAPLGPFGLKVLSAVGVDHHHGHAAAGGAGKPGMSSQERVLWLAAVLDVQQRARIIEAKATISLSLFTSPQDNSKPVQLSAGSVPARKAFMAVLHGIPRSLWSEHSYLRLCRMVPASLGSRKLREHRVYMRLATHHAPHLNPMGKDGRSEQTAAAAAAAAEAKSNAGEAQAVGAAGIGSGREAVHTETRDHLVSVSVAFPKHLGNPLRKLVPGQWVIRYCYVDRIWRTYIVKRFRLNVVAVPLP